ITTQRRAGCSWRIDPGSYEFGKRVALKPRVGKQRDAARPQVDFSDVRTKPIGRRRSGEDVPQGGGNMRVLYLFDRREVNIELVYDDLARGSHFAALVTPRARFCTGA